MLGPEVTGLEDLVFLYGVDAGTFIELGLKAVEDSGNVVARSRGGDSAALDQRDACVLAGVEVSHSKMHDLVEGGLKVVVVSERPGNGTEALCDLDDVV